MELCFVSLVYVGLLLGFGGVVMGVDCSPLSGTFTLKTTRDVSEITTCQTFTGTLTVAADGPEHINLDGINTITGVLDVSNVENLRSLSSASLMSTPTITLQHLPKLSLLEFPALRNFTAIQFIDLPSLEKSVLATTGKVDNEIQDITIFNTSLKSVDWAIWPVGAILNISSNAHLPSFTIPYHAINRGSAVTIASNPSLRNLDFAAVSKIPGGLQISDNAKLEEVGFPALQSIEGFVRMSGNMANITMPALSSIPGALKIESHEDIGEFCGFLVENKLGVGHWECTGNVETVGEEEEVEEDEPTTTGGAGAIQTTVLSTTPKETDGAGKEEEGGISEGVKIGIGAAAGMLTVLVGVVAFVFFRKRARATAGEDVKKENGSETSLATSGASRGVELMDTSPGTEMNPKEMEGMSPRDMTWELEGNHGTSELLTPHSPTFTVGSMWSGRSEEPIVRHELPG